MSELDELKLKIKERIKNIKFQPHFLKRKKKRPYLSEELIKSSLKEFDNYLGFQNHKVRGNERKRIGIKISNRYNLVIVLEICKEHLNIITAWKTNRKWQKSVQK